MNNNLTFNRLIKWCFYIQVFYIVSKKIIFCYVRLQKVIWPGLACL